jgi:para-aminobenzoate synthetase component 2
MILFIDNYDSFTYNLVQYAGEFTSEIAVYRNDAITIDEIKNINPDKILISPGPCTPKEAGISVDVIKEFGKKGIPILGVCLGHQAIGYAYGGNVIRASKIMHGKISKIVHDKSGVFKDIPSPFTATRYHSLIVEKASLPDCLGITASTEDDGTIMGLSHKEYPVYGVQFHPESILTEHGKQIIRNFVL